MQDVHSYTELETLRRRRGPADLVGLTQMLSIGLMVSQPMALHLLGHARPTATTVTRTSHSIRVATTPYFWMEAFDSSSKP